MKELYTSPCGKAMARVMRLSDEEAEVYSVVTHREFRRRGLMRGVMAELLSDADREGVVLLLTASAMNGAHSMDNQQLTDWYARLGFDGLAVNGWGGTQMQRVPNPITVVS